MNSVKVKGNVDNDVIALYKAKPSLTRYEFSSLVCGVNPTAYDSLESLLNAKAEGGIDESKIVEIKAVMDKLSLSTEPKSFQDWEGDYSWFPIIMPIWAKLRNPPVVLRKYLSHRKWSEQETIFLLAGLEPVHTIIEQDDTYVKKNFVYEARLLDGKATEEEEEHIKWWYDNRWNYIKELWDSDTHKKDELSPQYCLSWASGKGIRVDWLDWAIENGLLEQVPGDNYTKPLGDTERTNNLRIIGGLINLMLSKTPSGKSISVYDSQSAIIAAMLSHNPKVKGISERNLQDKFAAGNEALSKEMVSPQLR